MAKSKLNQVIESLKAENEMLRAELKQKTVELESSQRWRGQAADEISRCDKLLDMIPYAPESDGDLSVRLMGTLLAVGKKGTDEKRTDI